MKRQFMMLVLAIFAMFACAGIAWAGDGKCYSDSDCGRGVKCRNNKCATAAGGKCYPIPTAAAANVSMASVRRQAANAIPIPTVALA